MPRRNGPDPVGRSRSGCMDDLSIALVMYEGAEEQDLVGPYEMFYWMSLFEALPSDRRPIGEPDFAVDFISESEFADYFYPKAAPKAKVFTVAPSMTTYRMSSGMQLDSRFQLRQCPGCERDRCAWGAWRSQYSCAYSGELVHRFRWKWSSVGEAGADLKS